MQAETCGGENWTWGVRTCVCLCVLGVWVGDTQCKPLSLWSQRSYQLVCSPAACCVFVSAKTSHQIASVINVRMRVRACVCIVCEQMCYTENNSALLRGIIGLTQVFLIPCSMGLPHHVPCICLWWGGCSSSLTLFLPLFSLCYLWISMLLSVFVGALDLPFCFGCVW